MDTVPVLYGFDINGLLKDGQERCFEMNKAEKYLVQANDQQVSDNSLMFWLFGEDTCPEMWFAVRKAKSDYSYLWPSKISELAVAELIFHIVSLQKVVQSVTDENTCLREEVVRLTNQLKHDVPESPEALSDHLMTSVTEISMCTMRDESVSTYYNPVPGINTILSCAEREVATDTGPTPTLTVNVREKMDQIRKMFYEGDTERQETLTVATSPVKPVNVALSSTPSTHVHVPKEASNENAFHPGRLQIRNDESSVPQSGQPGKSRGLQIFKDPEGLAEPNRHRHPLQTLTEVPPSKYHQPPVLLGVENMVGPVTTRDTGQTDETETGMTSNFTIPVVFDPPCASTSVFTRRFTSPPPPYPPPTTAVSRGPDEKIQQGNQLKQKTEKDDMGIEINSSPPSPTRPDSPLVEAFNQFVRSPDQNGRLRIDATKFIDVFLSKKSAKEKESGNKRPPLF